MARVAPAKLLAFLRAINVGGHTVTMADLRGHFEALGLRDVETFIASGNVIFASPGKDLAALARKIEAQLLVALGYEVAAFLRTEAELLELARRRAFPDARVRAAGAYCVGFLSEPLDPAGTKALLALRSDQDDFHVHGREVYWLCTVGQSDSKFSNVRFEKSVGVKTTFRGMNTISKLAAKYASSRKGAETE